jgi:hypothetical protein
MRLLNIILPGIEAGKANKILRNKIKEKDYEVPEKIDGIHIKEFEQDYKDSVERANRLEDKAKSLLIAWTIAITLILNLSSMVSKITSSMDHLYIKVPLVILAVLAVIYMVFAGMMVIQVLTKENIVHVVPIDDRSQNDKKSIYYATNNNNSQNSIRNNKIFAAYQALRNSIICLVPIFIVAILPL